MAAPELGETNADYEPLQKYYHNKWKESRWLGRDKRPYSGGRDRRWRRNTIKTE